MSRVKILFWIILAVFLCTFIYGSLFFSPRYKKSVLDPSNISVQTFLSRSPDKIPKEISIALDNFQKEVDSTDYEGLKNRNLFGRYEIKPPPKAQTAAPTPVEEEQPVAFAYQGTVMIAGKQAVILLEPEEGRSFFAGKGDRFRAGAEKTEYELIDIQQDEVILLKIGQESQKVIIPKKKP